MPPGLGVRSGHLCPNPSRAMLPSATFSREVLDELRCLDEAIAAICEGAESLRAGHLVNVANLTERLHAAAHRVVTVRERLAQVAEEAGCDGWEWEDREGLDQAVVEAVTRLAAREAERPRAALLGLVGRLASGSVVHRRESKRQEFEASRHRALEEIRRALAADLPPEFPIPRDPGTWLADAWELRDPELACFLNALGPKYPELAGFVENVEPGMWRDGESGTDSTSALAPARPPET